MNLADIRKKAQMEKRGESPPAAPEVRIAPVAPAPMEAEEPGMPLPEEIFTSPAPPVEQFRPQEAVPAPVRIEPVRFDDAHSFDPVALILAGREGSQGDEEEMIADAAVAADADAVFQEFLCFRVSDEKYAINIMQIKEIIKPREVTEVPRVPQFVSGILSLRGIIIPVFNMRSRLGLPAVQESPKERIIVIRKGEEFCGILVDEVIQVVRIAALSIEPPPAVLDAVDRDFVNGIGRYDGMMLILLNLEKILDINVC